jgi:C_GCAxxG_C_C family probable redox protein
MNQVEKTVNMFDNGLNCSQAMLAVFGEPFGVDLETAKRLGRPFGGGMGHLARTCGAVTGAIMVLGLARDNSDEGRAKQEVYQAVKELVRRFEKRHGTSACKELLGEDMSTEEGMRKIREEKLVRKICPEFVRDAAEILFKLL